MNLPISLVRTMLCAGLFGLVVLTASGQNPRAERRVNPDRPRAHPEGTGLDRNPPARPPSVPAVTIGEVVMPIPVETRSIDGIGNNTEHPRWGSADIPLLRLVPPAYADGTDSPAGAHRSSARAISNACAAASGDKPNSLALTDYVWQWGQFVDHDIDLSPVLGDAEHFDIAVPAGDPWFDPTGSGTATIPLERSFYEYVDGVRQQTNEITAFVDGSNVYGSSDELAAELRTNDGTGRLKTSAGDLLPFNVNGFDNAPSNSAAFFLAGDFRANEQIALTAMHTLFVREHNVWADQVRSANPQLSGDEVYETARVIVSAEIQAITYNEFLPAILGRDALPPYRGYRPEVNPGIANVFSTAAYRFGHSMLSSELKRLDARGRAAESGHISLANAFFNPQEIVENGLDSILRGLASQIAQEIDNEVIDDVRNFLFGPPGSGGFDLASLNIQRGRDHGLPSYNKVRESYGLRPVRRFSEINQDPQVQANLAAVYPSVNDIDAWVGGLAEAHVPGALVGQTWSAVIADQFLRLRDGDRFFYLEVLPRDVIEMVEEQTLATVVRRNTSIGTELQDDVFRADLSDQVFTIVGVEEDPAAGEVMITFTSKPGKTYRLESSAGLRQWRVERSDVASAGILTSVSVRMRRGEASRCFRVREQ